MMQLYNNGLANAGACGGYGLGSYLSSQYVTGFFMFVIAHTLLMRRVFGKVLEKFGHTAGLYMLFTAIGFFVYFEFYGFGYTIYWLCSLLFSLVSDILISNEHIETKIEADDRSLELTMFDKAFLVASQIASIFFAFYGSIVSTYGSFVNPFASNFYWNSLSNFWYSLFGDSCFGGLGHGGCSSLGAYTPLAQMNSAVQSVNTASAMANAAAVAQSVANNYNAQAGLGCASGTVSPLLGSPCSAPSYSTIGSIAGTPCLNSLGSSCLNPYLDPYCSDALPASSLRSSWGWACGVLAAAGSSLLLLL